MLTACPAPTPPAGDDVDASLPIPDSPPTGATLKLEVVLDRVLPAMTDADTRVTDIYINAMSVRAQGDAGDATQLDYEMDWDDQKAPSPITFENPPLGTYSTINIRITKRETGSDRKAFEIRGRARPKGQGGAFDDFTIKGELGIITVATPVALTLPVGATRTVTVQVDVDRLVRDIDWTQVDQDDGDYVLDDTNMVQMLIVHTGLRTAFSTR